MFQFTQKIAMYRRSLGCRINFTSDNRFFKEFTRDKGMISLIIALEIIEKIIEGIDGERKSK